MKEIEEVVKTITLSLGSVIEGVSAIIIGYAAIRALVLYSKSSLTSFQTDKLEIRLSLGKSLAVALEFLLAADILRTAVAPDWDGIGKLAAIAALRTLLNYFLERELKHHQVQSVR
ncbi:MAG: DUF1622 domain-containing protein [Flammeovirgaceae bacterium]|nr:DUF1622 domain-containing protein [Flammeovirgaceae bacterium]